MVSRTAGFTHGAEEDRTERSHLSDAKIVDLFDVPTYFEEI
jgi:hypothetical protein